MKPINNSDFFDITDIDYKEIKELFTLGTDVLEKHLKSLLYIRDEINENLHKNSKGKYTDMISLLLFVKIIEIYDASIVLFNSSCLIQLDNEVRVLFETCVSLRYILLSNSEERAAAYYVEKWIKERSLCQKILEQSLNPLFRPKEMNERIDAINALIKEDDLLLHTEKKFNKNVKDWYKAIGANIKDMCTDLKWDNVYRDIYSALSLESHGKNACELLKFNLDGHPVMAKFRIPYKAGTRLSNLCSFSSAAMIDLVELYFAGDTKFKHDFYSEITKSIPKKNSVIKRLDQIEVNYS